MKTKPHTFTEKLRLNIVRHKIQNMCEKKRQKEQSDPNGYDVQASCIAIADYQSIALNIKANSAEKFLERLNEKAQYAQQHCAFPGEFNGGKATYGSLQRELQYWYEHKLIHYSLLELLMIVAYQRLVNSNKK